MTKNFKFGNSINGRMETAVKIGAILTATDDVPYMILSDQPFNAGCNEDGTEWELELEVLAVSDIPTLGYGIKDTRDFSVIDSILF